MQQRFQYFIDLLIGMTEKELKARYKKTVFGFLWVLINPLVQMLVIGFIFTFIIKQPIEHYFYFLFVGLLVWNFFQLSLTKATPSIVHERSLIKKARFPRVVIPLSIIFSNFIHFLITLIILLIVGLFFTKTIVLWKLLLLIPVALWLLGLTVGISLLTAALNVRFRDINFFVSAILIVWFYATPVVYALSFIPTHLRWLWDLNPLTAIIQLFDFIFLNQQFPAIQTVLINILIAFVFLFTGFLYFTKKSLLFDDWV